MLRTMFCSRAGTRASTSRAGTRASTLLFAFWCLFAAGFGTSTAEAQNPIPGEIDPIDIPPEHDPLAHAWDRPDQRGGFYLRAAFGLGYESTHLGPAPWKDDYNSRSANGFATGFNLDIGAVLVPWVALHLTAHAGVLWNGDIEQEFGVDSSAAVRVAAYGVGPAATFFTPHDFYFTLGAGVGFARTQYSGDDIWTRPGFFMSTVAGKDLYVDRHFAFGLQMQIVYMLLGADHQSDEARVREFLFGTSFAYDSI